VTFSTNANISVTGNEMAASVGSVDAFSLVRPSSPATK
jgi:hypothetical protein